MTSTSIYQSTITVAKWYGQSLTLPNIKDSRFVPFATSCMGIAGTMIESKIGRNLRVALSDEIDTAYADPVKSLVVISRKFLAGDFSAIGQDKPQNASKTIGAILGVIVHEIGHFAYSPKDLRGYVDFTLLHTSKSKNQELARSVANILEDIYIEYQIKELLPNLAWTLDEINKLMLTDDKYKIAVRNMKKISAPDNLAEILNYILFAKVTREQGKVSSYASRLFALARSVTIKNTESARYELCLTIYDLLAPAIKPQSKQGKQKNQDNGQEQEQGQESGQEQGQGQGQDNQSDDSIQDDNQEQESKPQSKHKRAGEQEQEQGQADSSESGEQDNESGQDNQEYDPNDLIETIKAYESSQVGSTPRFDIVQKSSVTIKQGMDDHKIKEITLPLGQPTIEIDKRFGKLASIARAKASSTRAYGEQRDNGRNLRQIHRIATDSKIFADALPATNFQPMDIIILLDCSRSMVGAKAYSESGKYQSLLESAASAALGATIGLLNGKCTVQVYGHSADVDREEKTVSIYNLFKAGESINTLSARLNYLINNQYSLTFYNRDGYALQEIAKKFQQSKRKRVIIVISDGAPNSISYNYQGQNAIDHTRNVVNNLRKQGITVYSLSIDNSAYKPNNYIYGEQNNTCSTNPNAIDTMIRGLFDKR